MGIKKLLLLIIFFQFSCTEKTESKYQEKIQPKVTESKKITPTKKIKTREDRIKRSAQRNQNGKQKIQNELSQRKRHSKELMEKDTFIPSFQINTFSKNFEEKIKRYKNLDCRDNKWFDEKFINAEFRDSFEHSYAKTNLYDGKIFCLNDLNLSEADFAKLIYGRTEGGHRSDEISIVTGHPVSKTIYHLPLSYHYAIEGSETIVSSQIKGRKINRKIEKRYGWSNLHPDSLKKQPRRVIDQTFAIDELGKMRMINEKIELFNR